MGWTVKLVLTSVAPAKACRSMKTFNSRLNSVWANINGRYSELNWVPVLLFTTPIGFEELVAWYAAADICWITPLRDGSTWWPRNMQWLSRTEPAS